MKSWFGSRSQTFDLGLESGLANSSSRFPSWREIIAALTTFKSVTWSSSYQLEAASYDQLPSVPMSDPLGTANQLRPPPLYLLPER